MAEDAFTEPDETAEEWIDVRMSDPHRGEWDLDAVVVGSRVEYVDLRIRPALLASFIECLVDDAGEERAGEVLASVAEGRDVGLEARRTDG